MHETQDSVPLLNKEMANTLNLLCYNVGQAFYDPGHRKMLNTVNGCAEEPYTT